MYSGDNDSALASSSVHQQHNFCDDEKNNGSDEVSYIIDDEQLVPLDAKHLNQVHEELEKLNIATDVINKLEVQLDQARATFRQIQASWTQKLNDLSKKYGSSIEKARPYYEAKLEERRLREEVQNAAIRYERANSMHAIAKQQVKLTQDSLNRQKSIEPECLEVLNHHIQRINEAESERLLAEELHRNLSVEMSNLSNQITNIYKQNSRSIKKSRHYFEQRIEFTRILQQQKNLIVKLEAEVRQKKFDYTTSLRNLEQISDTIHEQRSLSSIKRESGVGCESSDSSASSSSSNEYKIKEEERRKKADYESRIAVEGIRLKLDQLTMECDRKLDALVLDKLNAELCLSSSSSPSNELSADIRNKDSGVILLAQQLLTHSDDDPSSSTSSKHQSIILSKDMSDFHYQTTLPEGAASSSAFHYRYVDNSSSYQPNKTHEIDECAERTEQLLQHDATTTTTTTTTTIISDTERSSASGDSTIGY